MLMLSEETHTLGHIHKDPGFSTPGGWQSIRLLCVGNTAAYLALSMHCTSPSKSLSLCLSQCLPLTSLSTSSPVFSPLFSFFFSFPQSPSWITPLWELSTSPCSCSFLFLPVLFSCLICLPSLRLLLSSLPSPHLCCYFFTFFAFKLNVATDLSFIPFIISPSLLLCR